MIFDNTRKIEPKDIKIFLKNLKYNLINELKVEELEEMFDFIVFYKNKGLDEIVESENVEILNIDFKVPIILDITTKYGCKNSELVFVVIEFDRNINLKYKINKEYIRQDEYDLIETAIETAIEETMDTLSDYSFKYNLKEISN